MAANYISPISMDALSSLCGELGKNNRIKPQDFDKYHVKRGLRNDDGTGVMAGLTRICSVEGYYILDGERIPKEGKLSYRGYDIKDIIDGCINGDRFGFEEVAWLLIFGELPTEDQLQAICEVFGECRTLPDEFIEDMIMKHPSKDIMNKMARCVMSLYSYDENPDDISVANVLRQSLQLIAQFPTMMNSAYQVKRRAYYNKSMPAIFCGAHEAASATMAAAAATLAIFCIFIECFDLNIVISVSSAGRPFRQPRHKDSQFLRNILFSRRYDDFVGVRCLVQELVVA